MTKKHTGTQTLEILSNHKVSPNDLMAEFNRYHLSANLGKLTIVSGSFNTPAFVALIACLENNKLHYVNFTGTQLNKKSIVELLNTLSKQTELETLILENCLLPESACDALTQLIKTAPNLTILNLNNHRLGNSLNIARAILSSNSLVQVTGLNDVPKDVKIHLDQNKNFQTLESYLDDWSEKTPNLLQLEVYKNTFYKKIDEIKKQPYSKSRLHSLLFQFYQYLAQNYHRNGDNQNAQKYYEKCLQFNNDKHAKFQIRMALSEMLFVQGAEVVEKLNKNVPDVQALSRDEVAELRTEGEVSLLQSYQHLNSAEEDAADASEKAMVSQFRMHCAKTTGEALIMHGEAILAGVDHYDFSREYMRIRK